MASLSEAEVEMLRRGINLRKVEPHPFVNVGQRVRISSGALAGLEGFIERKKNSVRVVVNIDLIMQSVAVVVDGEDLEPVGCGNLAS
jgi:transcription antitermination factor NusG